MSNTVEDQIVAMHFDNKQFESGVSQSLGTLDKLKAAMSFSGAGKGIEDINRSVSGFNMHPMASAIEGVSKMWLGLTTVAVTAISNITNKVVDSALKIGKSLTIDPLTAGFSEYSTNLNSIQTIIANTGAKLPAVNATLRQLNEYSDKTIYNFSQMAQNIGRFTAAGVAMGPATDAIKGMANVAALSGATSEQLNSAMYQMSQALSTGIIRLMDWNSLANANMGGTNIQKALQATAESGEDAGAAMKDAIASTGSFRDSLQAGWLTGDIFTKTMKVMAGQIDKTTGGYKAFSVEQLKGMGYSQQAAEELNRLSQASIESATKVKTIGQAYDVVKESIGSGWAQVFQNIFGNFNQSKKLWTGVTKYITDGVAGFFAKINKALAYWNKFGGRVEVIEGLKQAFKDLVRFFVPIKNAFKEVFPPGSAKVLVTMSEAFHSFFELFRLNVKQMHAIRVVFVGIFTAVKFLGTIVGFAIKMLGSLFGLLGSGAGDGGGFLDTIVETIESFVDWVREGKKLEKMLKGVSNIATAFFRALQPLVPVIQAIGDSIASLASEGGDIAKGLIDGIIEGINGASIQAALVNFANNIVTWIKDALGIHSPAETMIPIGVNIVLGIGQGIIDAGPFLLEALRKTFEFMAAGLGVFVEGLGSAFKNSMASMDLESFLEIVNTLLTGGFLLAATNVARAFSGISKSASGVLDRISSSLKVMQQDVKADIIKKIAISVLLLAGAAYILSQLDGKQLAYSMGAIAGLMTALVASMKILIGGDTSLSVKDIAKKSAAMTGMGVAMVAFSTAVVILAGAVRILGKMDPEEVVNGLKAIGAIVAGVVAATAILSKTGGGATIFATAAALLVLSGALVAFAGTIKIYSKLSWDMIIDGGGKAAAVILGLGLAMRAFGKFAVTGSIGLLIASVGLLILAKSLEKVAKIDSERLGDALTALVVTIGAVALAGMALSGGGAVGLLAGAAAMIVIAKALEILAKIPADDLTKAFVFIGLALTALVIAANGLLPAIPAIMAFGAAALLIGQAIALAGLGVLAFATALGVLAIVGPAGFQAVYDGVILLLKLVPEIAKAVGAFVLGLIQGFVDAAVPLTKAIYKLLTVMADAFIKFQPKLRQVFRALIETAFSVLESYIGRFIRFGIRVIIAFLTGIEEAIPRIAHKAANIVIAFMDAIEAEYPRVKRRAIQFIGFLAVEIVSAVKGIGGQLATAGGGIAVDLITGITSYLWTTGMDLLRSAASAIAGALPGWMRKVLGIDSPSKVMRDEVGQWVAKGVADGIHQHVGAAEKSSKELADRSLDAMRYAFNNSRKMGDSLRDIRPTIAPVLDLTQLEKDATAISGHLSGRHTINTGLSGRKASDISGIEGRRRADAVASINETYNFNQTINSPKPVNKVEIYRGTKSQFALFREVKG
jgi:tape measure domain-containing protein